MKRFVERTVKNGQVKVYGKMYRPQENHMKYDGRMEGERYTFGIYMEGNERLPFIAMCGDDEDGNKKNMVDGTLPWLWWDEVIQ